MMRTQKSGDEAHHWALCQGQGETSEKAGEWSREQQRGEAMWPLGDGERKFSNLLDSC